MSFSSFQFFATVVAQHKVCHCLGKSVQWFKVCGFCFACIKCKLKDECRYFAKINNIFYFAKTKSNTYIYQPFDFAQLVLDPDSCLFSGT